MSTKKKKLVFSLKKYLAKKAQDRALKLQFREARRTAKKAGQRRTLEDYMASMRPQAPHTHDHHDHNHVHEGDEGPIVIHEDDLSQPIPETV
jgi:hypothetical protein